MPTLHHLEHDFEHRGEGSKREEAVVAKPYYSSSVSHVSHGAEVEKAPSSQSVSAVPAPAAVASSPQAQASAPRSTTTHYFPGRVNPNAKPSPFKPSAVTQSPQPKPRQQAPAAPAASAFSKPFSSQAGFSSTVSHSSGDAAPSAAAFQSAGSYSRVVASSPVFKQKAQGVGEAAGFSTGPVTFSSNSEPHSSSYSSLSSPHGSHSNTFSNHPSAPSHANSIPSTYSGNHASHASHSSPSTYSGHSGSQSGSQSGLAAAVRPKAYSTPAHSTSSAKPTASSTRTYQRLSDDQAGNAVHSAASEEDFDEDEEGYPRFTANFRPTSAPAKEQQSRYEDDRATRVYRHGTSGDGERSFVEVGMGGYPDGAYEYVESGEQH